MLHASLHDPGTYEPLLAHPTWRRVLRWLREMPADIALGDHELAGRELFVSVQEYATLPPEQARFESHEAYVDLQYTISGCEGIDWSPRAGLQPDGAFANDVQFWLPPAAPAVTLRQAPGRFCVFFPADAHRPKVRVPGHDRVRKLVVKVHLHLLASGERAGLLDAR